jgi:hypothetical protein
MKGVVFNILEEFILENWGDDVLDDIMDVCPLHTKEPFVGPKTYPDSDLFALVTTATEKLGVPVEDAVRAFGRFAFPRLAGRFPVFLEGHQEAQSFMLSVHDVIHVEVAKLMEGAVLPDFIYHDSRPGSLVIDYYSSRQLCHLFEGLLMGVGDHFNTEIEFKHSQCTHRGDAHCRFEMTFLPRAMAA